MRVAVLGTGIMGSGMARSLLRSGLDVTVWNRTSGRAASGAARPEVRLHTVTARPDRSRLRAMPAPMIPVPSTATRISDLPR